MSDETGVKISAYDNFSATYNKFIAANEQAAGRINKLTSGLAQVGQAVAGVYAIKTGVEFLNNALNEAAAHETEVNRLGLAIKNVGVHFGASAQQVEQFAEQVQKQTAFDNTEVVAAFNKLVVTGLNYAQSQKIITAAMNLAAGAGGTLEGRVTMLVRAYEGQARGFKQLGIEGTKFSAIMGEVEKKYGGQAAAQLDTYAGKTRALENTWKDYTKTIGNFWLPVAKKAIDALNQLVRGPENKEIRALPNVATYTDGLTKTVKILQKDWVEAQDKGKSAAVWIEQHKQWELLAKVIVQGEGAVNKYIDTLAALGTKTKELFKPAAAAAAGPEAPTDYGADKAGIKEREKNTEEMFKKIDGWHKQYTEARNKFESTMDDKMHEEKLKTLDEIMTASENANLSDLEIEENSYNKKLELAERLKLNQDAIDNYRVAMTTKIEKAKMAAMLEAGKAMSAALSTMGNTVIGGLIDGAIKMVEAMQIVVNNINAMLTASGPVGFIMGLLGVVTGAANIISATRELEKLKPGTDIESYASGTNFVPETGLYELHKGEQVVPADKNTGGGVVTINPVFNISSTDSKDVNLLAEKIGLQLQKMVRGQGQVGMTPI